MRGDRVDLHTHSSESDGTLGPAQLVARAAARGVQVLALTDHDTTSGLSEAQRAAAQAGLRLVPGVEVSADWEGTTLHVIGLNIDVENRELQAGLARTRAERLERARAIARSLADAGIEGALAGAMKQAGNAASIGRAHFARYLVAMGCARTTSGVFNHYMTKDKPGHVEHRWVSLDKAVRWIKGAGGQAVLAHPWRYGLAAPDLARLAGSLRDMGADALEVAFESGPGWQAGLCESIATSRGLDCSHGSDFHCPGDKRDLGTPGPRVSLDWAGIEQHSGNLAA